MIGAPSRLSWAITRPGQLARVRQRDRARGGHRAVDPAQHDRRVGGRQPFPGHEEQLLQCFGVVAQRGGHVDVERADRVAAQRLLAARHRLGHLDHINRAGELGGDEQDRLGAVHQHGAHLVAVGGLGLDVGGDAERHEEIDVRQRIADAGRVGYILQRPAASLARTHVNHVGAVGAGAVEYIVALQRHHAAAIAVADHRALRRDAQRPLHQARRDADAVALFDLEALLLQQRQRLRLVQADAGAVQDLQAGVMQPLGLVVRQLAETGGFVGGIVGL